MVGSSSSRRAPVGLLVAVGLAAAVVGRLFSQGSDATSFVGSGPTVTHRNVGVAMKAGNKAMKERIVSVGKTSKITDAMRLVAAAKIRRAQDGVEKSRPFSDELQSMIQGLVKKLKGTGLEAELPMLRVPEKLSNVGMVLITANRGLCGGYNSFILKRARRRIEDLNEQGIVPKLIIVGRKGETGLRTKLSTVKLNYTGLFINMPDTINSKTVNEVSTALQNLFLSGEVDKVEVAYTKFINLLTFEPSIRTVLPLTATGFDDPEDELFTLTSTDGKLSATKEKRKGKGAKEIEADVLFDQPPEVILNSMLPLYLSSQLLSLLYDSQASELASRMTAMKAATDNAVELVARLTTIYNKERQAQITNEVLEINNGAVATEIKEEKGGPQLGPTDNEESVGPDFLEDLASDDIPDTPPLPFDILSDKSVKRATRDEILAMEG